MIIERPVQIDLDSLTPEQKKWVAENIGYVPKPVTPPPSTPTVFTQTYEIGDGQNNRPEVGGYTNNGWGERTNPDAKEWNVYRFAFRLPHNRDLTPADIAGYRETLEIGLREGKKGYIRFIYNYEILRVPPTVEQTLRHVNQLAAFLTEMRHAIVCIDLGFWGLWGEFHSDALTQANVLANNALRLRQAIERMWPKDLTIQVRYPRVLVKQPINPTGWFDWDKPLNEDTAYNPNATTWGSHGDSWGNLPQESTWWPHNRQGSVEWEQQQNFVWENAQWSYYSGEPVPVGYKSPWDISSFKPMTRPEVISHVLRSGTSLLNLNGNANLKQYMMQDPASYNALKSVIGYNLNLVRTMIDIDKGFFDLTLVWKNLGSSGLHNKRPAFLMFNDIPVLLSNDFRKNVPRKGGELDFVSLDVKLPDLARGNYRLGLWLPDNHPGLRNDSRFSIQLNNKNMAFDGVNGLGITVTI
jgi:hypothetical protein